jgi:hypothetical protein
MWKVKRMNRARIVVLTIAIGAGGVAAYLATGSDGEAATPTGRVTQPALSLAQRSIAAVNQIDIASNDQTRRRGNIEMAGATGPTAVHK